MCDIEDVREAEEEDSYLDNVSLIEEQENELLKPKLGRKRKFPNQTQVTRKALNNNNEPHFMSTGNFKESKSFSVGCCSCERKCNCIINLEDQQKLFSNFYSLGSFEARTTFISQNVEEFQPAKCLSESQNSRRKFSRVYKLKQRTVCKEFFLSLLQISSQSVQTALNKWRQENVHDLRGRHSSNKYDDETKKLVEDHIKSFPRYVSHYKRETTSANYLNSELNITKMYELFVEMWKQEHQFEKLPGKLYYQKIFSTFNLKFKPLKTDTCKTCDILNIKLKCVTTMEEKEKIEVEQARHQREAEFLSSQMKKDFERSKEDPNIQVFAFDLQKVLQLPKTSTSIVFYLRCFSMFNLGIHEASTGTGHFYTWLENQAGRGSQEIASCIIKHLNLNLKVEAETIICWCDCCGGQNRNQQLCLMLQGFLSNQPNLKKIIIRFLCSGHSYMSCDRDFGFVEKAVNKAQTIFLPEDYRSLMKSSKKENPFVVTEMLPEDFLSAKPIMKHVTKRDKDMITKEKVSWLKTHQITIHKDREYHLYLKYDLTSEKVEMCLQGKSYSNLVCF